MGRRPRPTVRLGQLIECELWLAAGSVLSLDGVRGLKLTGQLGDVMKESANIARSLMMSHASRFGIDPAAFQRNGIHVHVPAGAMPKDGPSAGVAMVTALASLFIDTPARADTAMTGEVTLTGLVLPIGGVKEKVLAARRAGITRIVLPKANEKDLRDVPENVRREMTFHFASTVDEVLAATLPHATPRASLSVDGNGDGAVGRSGIIAGVAKGRGDANQ